MANFIPIGNLWINEDRIAYFQWRRETGAYAAYAHDDRFLGHCDENFSPRERPQTIVPGEGTMAIVHAMMHTPEEPNMEDDVWIEGPLTIVAWSIDASGVASPLTHTMTQDRPGEMVLIKLPSGRWDAPFDADFATLEDAKTEMLRRAKEAWTSRQEKKEAEKT